MTDPIVIIGAGIGGLSAAIRLAAAGKRVAVYEQSEHVGGKMGQLSLDGFRWDTGPSVITMRHVLEELFHTAGRELADYIDLVPVEPLTRYFYPDGTVLNATRDSDAMAAQIEALEPGDAAGYRAYLDYAAQIHRITGPIFIYGRPPTLASFARVPVWDWLKADPLRTMHRAITSFVRSPHLRQLLGRFATYVGGSPYQAPATLNVIADVELNGGVWYPRGGIYTIAEGLRRLARELGVEIHPASYVKHIAVRDGRATGITLADGTVISASAVLSNVDVTTTYTQLLPPLPAVKRLISRLQRSQPSCSGFILLLGVEKTHNQLAHHNIFFSADYRAEFDAIFNRGVPANDPTIYAAITSKTDAEHAPLGSENWFILVNAPALSDTYDWQTEATAYRDLVLDRLAAHGFDLRPHIVVERCLTPVDLQAQTGAWRGALYGPSPNSRWAAFRRAHNRCADVRDLYFAGGTAHPGGGVPMVVLSGKVAADLILQDAQV